MGDLLPRHLLHGGDYNPEQWLDRPDILEEDIRLMKKAGVNCVTLGVFSWAALEPEEGEFTLDWLQERIDRLYENGISTILATPTGALPMWLSAGQEEVHQMFASGIRRVQGYRHNFCPTSPVMRRHMEAIDTALARRFGGHPGVIAWHLSNEYGGNGPDSACYCPLCRQAFRQWLKDRYQTLDNLNHAWWTSFWSHTYTDWEQIVPPMPQGDTGLHGLNLDWRRFTSWQMQNFMEAEIGAVRRYSSRPVTANFMVGFKPYDYNRWAKALDFVSIDSYPAWHAEPNPIPAATTAAMTFDLMRSMKRQPFLLMESVPSTVSWQGVNPVKRPGMHGLSSLQAVAAGSNSVQYFQWRKSRGGPEKYHGAVIDHKNGENTRVFRDVAALGRRLEALSPRVLDTCNRPKAAVIFDWENWWALEDCVALYPGKDYFSLVRSYYTPLWELGIDVDVVDMDADLDCYSLVVAPVNYLYRGAYADRVRAFVRQGGTYVTTWFSGEVDETDLCYLDRHPLGDVLGICPEEMDAPADWMENSVAYGGTCWPVTGARALVRTQGAEVLAVYGGDFYAGQPALTRNVYGRGKAYFIASQNAPGFLRALFRDIGAEAGVGSRFAAALPEGVTVRERIPEAGQGKSLFFLQNFHGEAVSLPLSRPYADVETGQIQTGEITLDGYSCRILEETE